MARTPILARVTTALLLSLAISSCHKKDKIITSTTAFVRIESSESGSVFATFREGSGEDTTVALPFQTTVSTASQITVSVPPTIGGTRVFNHWDVNGAEVSGGNSISMEVNNDLTLRANFADGDLTSLVINLPSSDPVPVKVSVSPADQDGKTSATVLQGSPAVFSYLTGQQVSVSVPGKKKATYSYYGVTQPESLAFLQWTGHATWGRQTVVSISPIASENIFEVQYEILARASFPSFQPTCSGGEMYATLISGDNEFGGNGPSVTIRLSRSLSPSGDAEICSISLRATFTETNSSSPTVGEVIRGPVSTTLNKFIRLIEPELSNYRSDYVDTDHEVDAITPSLGPIAKYEISGDTGGGDVLGACPTSSENTTWVKTIWRSDPIVYVRKP